MVGTRDFGFEEGGTTFNFDFERNIARTCWNDSGVRLLAYPEKPAMPPPNLTLALPHSG